MEKYIGVLARILLAQIFLVALIIQISGFMQDPAGYQNFQIFLGQRGLAAIFAPLMILIQLVGGTALLLGYKTKFAAYLLAGYSVFIAFAIRFNDPVMFMQYLAITGGLLTLAINDRTACSLDNCLQTKE
jgi:putative oxidoreductase